MSVSHHAEQHFLFTLIFKFFQLTLTLYFIAAFSFLLGYLFVFYFYN